MMPPCSATVSLKLFVGDQIIMIFQYSLRGVYSPVVCMHFIETQYRNSVKSSKSGVELYKCYYKKAQLGG